VGAPRLIKLPRTASSRATLIPSAKETPIPIPYLHFQGHCAEALAPYSDIFGSDDLQLMRYSDAPDMDDALRDPTRVIHGQISLPDGVLMASDYPPGMTGDAQAAVSIMQVADTVPEARRDRRSWLPPPCQRPASTHATATISAISASRTTLTRSAGSMAGRWRGRGTRRP